MPSAAHYKGLPEKKLFVCHQRGKVCLRTRICLLTHQGFKDVVSRPKTSAIALTMMLKPSRDY